MTPIWAGLYTRPPMVTDAIHPSRRLPVTQRDERGGARLTPIWAGLYTCARMGTDTIHSNRRLAVTRLTDLPTYRLTARR